MDNVKVGDILGGTPCEGNMLTINDNGAFYFRCVKNPTEYEIQQYETGAPLEVRFRLIHGIIMLSIKPGALEWYTAAFPPQYSVIEDILHDDQLYDILFLLSLVDARNNEVKSIKVYSLGEAFSAKLREAVRHSILVPMNDLLLRKHMRSIRLRYPNTKSLVEDSKHNSVRLTVSDEYDEMSDDNAYPQEGYVNKRYRAEDCPVKVPEELVPYYAYHSDAGHHIEAVPETLLEEAKKRNDLSLFVVPVPVPYILEKGYRFLDGFVVVDVPYNRNIGMHVADHYFIF